MEILLHQGKIFSKILDIRKIPLKERGFFKRDK
jgi:hypothetical protein